VARIVLEGLRDPPFKQWRARAKFSLARRREAVEFSVVPAGQNALMV
jgi:hypothetical protein